MNRIAVDTALFTWLITGIVAHMPKKARTFTQNADGLIDEVNRKLLSELQDDARLTVAELGRRVGLSSPAVAERLQRLEGAGAIKGYHAQIDPRALGLFLPARDPHPPGAAGAAEGGRAGAAHPEVVECLRITGEDCFIMKLHLRDVEHLEEVIDRFVIYGQTTTRSFSPRRCPGAAWTWAERSAEGLGAGEHPLGVLGVAAGLRSPPAGRASAPP